MSLDSVKIFSFTALGWYLLKIEVHGPILMLSHENINCCESKLFLYGGSIEGCINLTWTVNPNIVLTTNIVLLISLFKIIFWRNYKDGGTGEEYLNIWKRMLPFLWNDPQNYCCNLRILSKISITAKAQSIIKL